jgi:hypothetical protein
MKQVPRFLGVALILALLNVSYMSVALATRAPSRIIATATADSTLTTEPYSEPIPEPTPTHASKADIKQDLDDTKADLQTIIGTDPNGFAAQLLSGAGLDPVEDIDDAKTDLDTMSATDFDNAQSHFDKLHKKFQKRKHNTAAILRNPTLMAMLHRPSPVKFRVVVGNSESTSPANERTIPSFSKSGSASGRYSKDLANLKVLVTPELNSTCSPGDGVSTDPVNLLTIAKALTVATEIVKEAIPEDSMVVPHTIAAVAWGAAKTAEFVLDTIHHVYADCKAVKSEHDADQALSNLGTSLTNVKNDVTSIKTTVGNTSTTITNVSNNVDTVKTTVNNVNTTVNNIGTQINAINSTVTTTSTNVNTANANITATQNSINTFSELSLRLMIEADLAAADNSTPVALFVTPAAKQGYLELVRTIVATTIANLAGSSAAQANSFLAQGDAFKAAGNYKSAYAAYRKAYKSASS